AAGGPRGGHARQVARPWPGRAPANLRRPGRQAGWKSWKAVMEVGVHVGCPDDDEPGPPVKAVLRGGEAGLVLWRFHPHEGKGLWLRQRFRPFRGRLQILTDDV